jgi:hypothetical protein
MRKVELSNLVQYWIAKDRSSRERAKVLYRLQVSKDGSLDTVKASGERSFLDLVQVAIAEWYRVELGRIF